MQRRSKQEGHLEKKFAHEFSMEIMLQWNRVGNRKAGSASYVLKLCTQMKMARENSISRNGRWFHIVGEQRAYENTIYDIRVVNTAKKSELYPESSEGIIKEYFKRK